MNWDKCAVCGKQAWLMVPDEGYYVCLPHSRLANGPADIWHWLLEQTTCRLGWHSRRKIRKFDGGMLPLLCRHCRVITGWDR